MSTLTQYAGSPNGGSGAATGIAIPRPLGTAAAGSATAASHEDHVHALPSAATLGVIPASEKGAASGVATLDGTGKVPSAQLPASVAGGLNYQGTWNASTNSPTMAAGATGNKAYYFKVSVSGATSVDGITDWKAGDFILSNGVTWDKVDNTDPVLNGMLLTGLSTAASTDIVAGDDALTAFGKLQAKWNALTSTVRGVLLTGLDASVATDLVAGDSILAAFGKLQGKWNALATSVRAVVLTGYTIGTAVAVATTDTFSQAIGKLEALVGTKVDKTALNVATATALTAGRALTYADFSVGILPMNNATPQTITINTIATMTNTGVNPMPFTTGNAIAVKLVAGVHTFTAGSGVTLNDNRRGTPTIGDLVLIVQTNATDTWEMY